MKKKLFILSIFPAPYRVFIFRELAKKFEIFVAFERNNDTNRSGEWFINDLGFTGVILDNPVAQQKYDNEINNLKTYDIVFAYDYSSLASMKLMLKCLQLRIPYFINCDGAFINRHPIKDIVKRFFISRATACLASGKHAEEYFLTYGAKINKIYRHNFSSLSKADILSELLTWEEKQFIRSRLGLPINQKLILSVGQFAHRKGFDTLLEAWKNINEDAYLIIVGGGEKEDEYKTFIKYNNLKRVIIDDFKPKNILFDYYKASDIFVLPTREDIWGLVINEAMACGLPVITTDKCIAGLELIENGKNGFIVPVDDVDMLSARMNEILADDNLKQNFGRINLQKILHFTIEDIADSHTKTINQVSLI